MKTSKHQRIKDFQPGRLGRRGRGRVLGNHRNELKRGILTRRMEAVPPNDASIESRLLNLVDLTWYLQQ
jgi:hypothetical protein